MKLRIQKEMNEGKISEERLTEIASEFVEMLENSGTLPIIHINQLIDEKELEIEKMVVKLGGEIIR
ncbi:MAG: hypothetical protein ACTSQA_00500 [Candidatus Heimdallarchaeaceae archaeon]